MSGQSPKLTGQTGIDTSVPAGERYRILGRIASGGMAEIYLANMKTSAGVEREVVLKRLMPELQSDHEFVQMFYDEARIASQMKHPNIVQIYELGELDGSLFISMELLRGVNLRDLLGRIHEKNIALPVPYGVRIACGALEALAYAHKFTDSAGRLLNVVHRDVSPQNIIVTYDGLVKLVDFGVAKAEGRLHQTRAGLIKGKFAYMSPEQISGGKVDGRSDLFALAEVFYELLLRRHPFYAQSDMAVLRAILDSEPTHPCSLDQDFPPELGAILMRALRKNPTERYATAAAMNDTLEAFLQQTRTPVTTIVLGRYIREVFADRVEMEQKARDSGDESLLIESMTAGRVEPAAPKPKKRSHSRPALPPSVERSDPKALFSTKSGVRDQVVEVPRTQSDSQAPADAAAFIAHSGYTDPGVQRRRFRSQVRRIFDDPADSTPAGALQGELSGDTEDGPTAEEFRAGESPAEDEGELPTMLGTLTMKDLEEIKRSNEAKRRVQAEKRKPASGEKSPLQTKERTPQGQGAVRSVPASAKASVTARSRTVLRDGDTFDEAPPSDRWGLLLFVAGLGALVGAIVYAIILYTGSQLPVMRLEVRSTPPGASILFDGVDTGAQTPSVFQNIPSNKEHALELRLDGYEPYARRLAPSPDLGELIVNWTFRPSN